ncbi:acyl carrier protein [Lentzea fradiae]|uniref:acyl carrier protein n=1 Tax=Lentzea fradiae TaxID=200378 RepID=UPI00159FCEFF|nr:acyl carrier protein [Lentzea fradiae]
MHLVVGAADWKLTAAGRPGELLSELPGVKERVTTATPVAVDDIDQSGRARDALAPAARARALLDLVRDAAARAQGRESRADVDPARGFHDQGFDSLAVMRLRNSLVVTTGLRIAPSAVFDHPTPAELAVHLDGLLAEFTESERNFLPPQGERSARIARPAAPPARRPARPRTPVPPRAASRTASR